MKTVSSPPDLGCGAPSSGGSRLVRMIRARAERLVDALAEAPHRLGLFGDPDAARGPRRIALALQGGGAYGAFTWGVLDCLAAQDHFEIDMISGTSAGAVNAVLFASGYAEGGAEGARRRLERFWGAVGQGRAARPFELGLPGSRRSALAMVEASAMFVSPYQFNPLGLNPLRRLLEQEVDFDRLRRAGTIRVLIAATRIRDGALRLFETHEITVDAVLASACLPKYHHAVEIDGESYWDGGFSANPPLRQLALDTRAADLVLVEIMPRHVARLPQSALDIARRTMLMAFNGALDREIEALGHLMARAGGGEFPEDAATRRRLRALRLHRISAVEAEGGLTGDNMLDTSPAFLDSLYRRGIGAAESWVQAGAAVPAAA